MTRNVVLVKATLAVLLWGATAQAPAQSYPSKPIRFLVPFTAGSASDILARVVGDKLAQSWGQPVLVENRPGAGGTIATGMAAKSTPDGYTLVVVSAGHVVNPVIYANLSYDTLADLSGVIPLANLPSVLAVSPQLGVKSAADLVAAAKSKPGQLNYVSGGVGSASHVNAEKFRAATGFEAQHVPLKGAPDMVVEIASGRAQFGFLPIIAALPAIRDGKLVPLAVSSARRSSALPEAPSVVEAGIPQGVFNFWIGLLAPVKTPREIVRKLHDEIAHILLLPDVAERLKRLGAEPLVLDPDQFDRYMAEEFQTLGAIMRGAGVKAQ